MFARKLAVAAAVAVAALGWGAAPASAQFVSYGYPAVPAVVSPYVGYYGPVAYNPYVGYSYNPYFAGTYSPYIGHAFPRLSLYRGYYAAPVYSGYSYTSYYNPVVGQAVSIYSGY